MEKRFIRGLAVPAAALGLILGSAATATAATPSVQITQGMVATGGTVQAVVTSTDPQGLVQCQWATSGDGTGPVNLGGPQSATTSGFTNQTTFTSPQIPANTTGLGNTSPTTTVSLSCQQWLNGAWQQIGSAVSIPTGDPRPEWCRSARRFINRGEHIQAGTWIISPSCTYGLTIQQTDGNVVLYRLNPTANAITLVSVVAATNQLIPEFQNAPSFLMFQASDGNLVQYLGQQGAVANAVAWTGVSNGQALFVQDDGNVVMYASGDANNPTHPVWARHGLANANAAGQARPTHGGSFAPNHFFALNTN